MRVGARRGRARRARAPARAPAAPSSLLAAGRARADALRARSRSRWRRHAAINDHISDAGYVGALPAGELKPLSSYLLAHQGSARYEVAAESATRDRLADRAGRTPDRRPHDLQRARLHERHQAEALIAAGELRYAFLNTSCGHPSPTNPACSAPAGGSAPTAPTSRARPA